MSAPVPPAGGRQQVPGLVALVVREYEEALDFYVGTLGDIHRDCASYRARSVRFVREPEVPVRQGGRVRRPVR